MLLPLALFLGSALGATALLAPAHGTLLSWDEVDYVNAARLGFQANAMERGSLPPSAFLSFSHSKLVGQDPNLPAHYDEDRDPLVLRHYHPPFVVYLLSLVAGAHEERLLRSVQLLGAWALLLSLVMGYRAAGGVLRWPGASAVVIFGLWLTRGLFASLSFHGWAAVWTTTAATLLGKWLTSANPEALRTRLYGSLALCLLTLETGLVVCLGALLYSVLWRVCHGASWRRAGCLHLAFAALSITLIVTLAWPGALIRMSIGKIAAAHIYRILRGQAYVGAAGASPQPALALLPGVACCLWAVVWVLWRCRSEIRCWGPFLAVGGLYALAVAPVAVSPFALRPQYLLPALAALAPLIGLAVDRSRRAWRAVILGALLAAVVSVPGGPDDLAAREDLRWCAGSLNGRTAWVDGGHVYRHYLGPGYSIRSVSVPGGGQSLTVREGGRYRSLAWSELSESIVMIRKERREFFGGVAERVLLERCHRLELSTAIVYDCLS